MNVRLTAGFIPKHTKATIRVTEFTTFNVETQQAQVEYALGFQKEPKGEGSLIKETVKRRVLVIDLEELLNMTGGIIPVKEFEEPPTRRKRVTI